MRELVYENCRDTGIEVLALDCSADHMRIKVSVLPTVTIPNIITKIKEATMPLKNEFDILSGMSNLWTLNYFVSTEETISQDVIDWYVSTQKNHPKAPKKSKVLPPPKRKD